MPVINDIDPNEIIDLLTIAWENSKDEVMMTKIRLFEKDVKENEKLLPERMVFTQRILWGKKGLLRSTGIAPLNNIQREKELKLRRSMLITHQVLFYKIA